MQDKKEDFTIYSPIRFSVMKMGDDIKKKKRSRPLGQLRIKPPHWPCRRIKNLHKWQVGRLHRASLLPTSGFWTGRPAIHAVSGHPV